MKEKISKKVLLESLIMTAGYHADQTKFLRLYTENRISLVRAKQYYAAGINAKLNNQKCQCFNCNN